MASYWLRVEAQNLSSFLLDTQDLSTVRGASLALLHAVEAISTRFELKAVTVGASIGWWRFECADRAAADALAGDVRRFLSVPEAGSFQKLVEAARHATFAVVVEPATDGGAESRETSDPEKAAANFIADRELLIARARRAQLSAPALVYPARAQGRDVCSIDLVRPAAARNGEAPVSPATRERREYGRRQKQTFYQEQFARAEGDLKRRADAALDKLGGRRASPFAWQIGSISEAAPLADPDEDRRSAALGGSLRPSLSGKIAVFYMDGNGFGALQDALIKVSGTTSDDEASDPAARKTPGGAEKAQTDFDVQVQGYRRELLVSVLELLADDPWPAAGPPSPEEEDLRRLNGSGGEPVARFETLLWGGDELMFIAPARFGWRIAELVAERTAGWSAQVGGATRRMHNACGLVFCHHDAPISRIQDLARGLADHAKDLEIDAAGRPFEISQEDIASFSADEPKPEGGRRLSLLTALVLESFDHVGTDLAGYIARRAGAAPKSELQPEAAKAFMTLELGQLSKLRAFAEKLRDPLAKKDDRLSRRRLRLIAQSLHRSNARGARSTKNLSDKAPDWATATPERADAPHEAVEALGWNRAFLLAEEFWDYLAPVRREREEDAA